jgi:hypothetical protein
MWLRTGRTSRLNEPVHKEKYTREEAKKLYKFWTQTVPRVPKYWFMEQDEFQRLRNELWLRQKTYVLRKGTFRWVPGPGKNMTSLRYCEP